MKKHIILFSVLLAIFSASPVFAAKGIIKNIGTGSSGSITVADLGVLDVGTLPLSKWYFAKEWRRGVERLFTFDAVVKTELELRIANEKAAEALMVEEARPDDRNAIVSALENYTKAQERLAHRLLGLKETSENPNVEKLLEKLDEQNLKHALLFNQLAQRWSTDPYVEDANIVNPNAAKDNHLQGAVDIMQKKIQEIIVIAAEKDKNIEQKAVEQIAHARERINELESVLAKQMPGFIYTSQTQSAGSVINEPARVSTNMTIERQTPKRDYGDRMKAGLETAGGVLANGKQHLDRANAAFAEQKFGEAFGEARSAEVLAINGSRIFNNILRADTGGLEDGMKAVEPRSGRDVDTQRIEDVNSAMPVVPDTKKTGGKIIPEMEKRVVPATNTQATQPINTTKSPSTESNSPPAAKTGGYAFTLTGNAEDIFDLPAMTSGPPVGGVTVRVVVGTKTFTAQTGSNGIYTISLIGVPLGTYEVCAIPPSGYRMSAVPASGCEPLIVRQSTDYPELVELEIDGRTALKSTVVGFNLLRSTDNGCPTEGPEVCGKDGRTYYNACFATKNGAEVSYEGECSLDGWLKVNGGTAN